MIRQLCASAASLTLALVFFSPTLTAQCGGSCFGTAGGTMVAAGTYVNQDWCLQNSPYIVTGNISVGGVCIQPGVEVLIDPGFEICVSLTIIANGTASAPITFDCSTPGMSWAGFRFQSTPPGSMFRHCVIRHSSSSAFEIIDSSPFLKECLIEGNTNFGGSQRGGGIDATFVAGSPAGLVLGVPSASVHERPAGPAYARPPCPKHRGDAPRGDRRGTRSGPGWKPCGEASSTGVRRGRSARRCQGSCGRRRSRRRATTASGLSPAPCE